MRIGRTRSEPRPVPGTDTGDPAQRVQVLRLQYLISQLAGEAAEAQEQLAATYRDLSQKDPARSAEHHVAAVAAERASVRMRAEQRRWQLP